MAIFFIIFFATLISCNRAQLIPDLDKDLDVNALIEAVKANPFVNVSKLLPNTALNLVLEKYTPVTKSNFEDEYDYIIVGAGSAGSVVASRLSEISCVKVLLLEAGKAPPMLTEVPILARLFYGTDIDWKIFTVPQKNTAAILDNRRVPLTVGKAIGGSSVWNAMLYIRGNRQNFDDWASNGATGWSYEEVLPYFLKMDGNRIKDFENPRFHNNSGPLTAERPSYNPEYKKGIFEAAKADGYRIGDSNAENQIGFFDFATTMRDGRRCSAGKAYLVPADSRSNLDIIPEAFVNKVLLDGGRAIGVEVKYRGSTRQVRARKEVIVSAGAVHTPKVLMLSGIGPKEHLESFNIPVVADLPVGKNFHDHPGTFTSYAVEGEAFLPRLLNPTVVSQYLTNSSGMFTSPDAVNALAFLSRTEKVPVNTLPDYQLYFIEGVAFIMQLQVNMKQEEYQKYYGPHDTRAFVWCVANVLNPKSRGTITLQSKDPMEPPLVDPNYFDDPQDFEDNVVGLKTCRKILSNPALKKLNPKPFSPEACQGLEDQEDEYVRCIVRSDVFSFAHPAGTAKMGAFSDSSTVVDPELRVKGISGLRVIDASIMPQVTSGNTNVPTMMIGEKGADMIKKSFGECKPSKRPKL